ncbi:MAG: RNA polymerase sigma factor (sigma-70 family) [Granulosicoccus sp.]|jgi:RNA polymerase sigma factor (sigma-70 family)
MNRSSTVETTHDDLIYAILQDEAARNDALKKLTRHDTLNEEILACTNLMGGTETDAFNLMDDVLIGLVKGIRQQAFPNKKISVSNSFLGKEEKIAAPLIEKIRTVLFFDKNENKENTIVEFFIAEIKKRWSEQLRIDDALRQQVMNFIAKDETDLKRRIVGKMKSLGHTNSEAEDIYQQGFIQLERLLKGNSYHGGDVKGFFRSLCINLKLNERRITKPDLPGESHHLDKHDHSMEMQMVKNEQKKLLENWLSQLGEKCRQTLQLWNDGFSMKEIAEKADHENAAKAALARFRCMGKLQELIDFQSWKKTDLA